ncbi:Asp-tRNA(Asn)/Glu-tRNA(Gln) amidotransferase subunit GatB [Fusibacter ferrireducens]|uniref:Aspartyl/glutamyl-tRNA(Asn/Gln) amidotransferase subunit B n=1 Tax=Fusibacter ferrireducens TaxID=2785058 RepID=A0ABR9ZT06_9FIRM|nr:Asp-tRNA(Asn)/Glu-tRNA(Gln) amidotransferase subunit GatB [Fusibacter ferrireducens]MBF4692734.1 Asp-tRNA(Asn)/Glu-tRNA(Gln) amidotransferase subunit GatB [Fusibacter ferrireducens]
MLNKYEVVIGLEVHVELKTKSKIFCGCSTVFGAKPNTQCCPICMGFPGTLPVLNETVVDYAIKAGLATHCDITRIGKQDRKNYFYPDLPKAYQISQYDLPLCKEGFVDISIQGKDKRIGITRIHIEEDAGKLMHDLNEGTMIDYNRCGVPLVEIVSEPDMRSADEAIAYLKKLRSILLYTEISDCKLNEGSFRCDVNLSVRKKGEPEFGTRTEMKNLNSFAFIKNAIEHETKRQIKAVESGELIVQETRRWDAIKGESYSMRTKEDAHDYRYFPDPDLATIVISEDKLNQIQSELPILPDERKKTYIEKYALAADAAEQLTAQKQLSDYFEMGVAHVKTPSILANLMMTDIFKSSCGDEDEMNFKISPESLAEIVGGIEEGTLNPALAKKAMGYLMEEEGSVEMILKKYDLEVLKDIERLTKEGEAILEEHPRIVKDFLGGKAKAMGAFMGQMMKRTQGKADPEQTEKVFKDIVDKLR